MKQVVEYAPAKLNLTLTVGAQRPDGFHDMDMVMLSVSLTDRLTLGLQEEAGVVFSMENASRDIPKNEDNLAVRAGKLLLEHLGKTDVGLSIHLEKRIPSCAGTAGGSSDAAAVLRGGNRLLDAGLSLKELAVMGASLGSDVPYCVLGGVQRAQGRGEKLSPLPHLPPCCFVLCKPDFSVSTPALFRAVDASPDLCHTDPERMPQALARGSLSGIARALHNDFEQVLPPAERDIVQTIKKEFLRLGALGSGMTGTGSVVFGLFAEEALAQSATEQLRKIYTQVFCCRCV